jgi:hypothetical protein
MAATKPPLRQHFEAQRRRASFMGFLTGAGIGIIATDTWVAPVLGIPGGILVGAAAYVSIYSYETTMWRRNHGA